jgi:hypothetical protein
MTLKYEHNTTRITTYKKNGYYYLNVLENNKRVMVMLSTDKEAIEHDFNYMVSKLNE